MQRLLHGSPWLPLAAPGSPWPAMGVGLDEVHPSPVVCQSLGGKSPCVRAATTFPPLVCKLHSSVCMCRQTLVRDCIAGLLVNLSVQDFKEIEGMDDKLTR